MFRILQALNRIQQQLTTLSLKDPIFRQEIIQGFRSVPEGYIVSDSNRIVKNTAANRRSLRSRGYILNEYRRPRYYAYINPFTGKPVIKNSPELRNLLNTQFNLIDGKLVPKIKERFIKIYEIWDPSDTSTPLNRNISLALSQNQLNILLDVIAGKISVDTFKRSLQDDFYETYLKRFTFNFDIYEWDQVRYRGIFTNSITQIQRNRINDFMQQRALKDNPLIVPFINIDQNIGTDDNCIERFLGKAPQEKTINGLVRTAESHGISIEIYDIMGGIICKSGDSKKIKRALYYNNHIYIMKSKKLELPSDIKIIQEDIYDLFDKNHRMYYEKNGKYYMDSIYKHEGSSKKWMIDFIELLPTSDFELSVLESLKVAAKSLELNNAPNALKTLYLDMSKCYYNCAKQVCKEIPIYNIFNKWESWDKSTIDYRYQYRINNDLSHLGLRTNIINGNIVNLLISNGIKLKITHQLKCGVVNCEPALNYLKSIKDPIIQKEYAICNGLMGRISINNSMAFEIHNKEEAKYYQEKYGFEKDNYLMTKNQLVTLTTNNFNFHLAVIQEAQYQVLEKMFIIKKNFGIEPFCIKVDSLIYNTDITIPEDNFWKIKTDFKHNDYTLGPIVKYNIKKPIPMPNITYTGAPGTGKTHKIINEHQFDIAVCYSNKGARRINGKTIHSALHIWGKNFDGKPDLMKLANKTIFVDEAQCIRRKNWGQLYQATQFGTKFIFAMDLNQLAPPCENKIDIHPIHGTIINLTKDHRNDAELIKIRNEILDGTFKPILSTEIPDINIAFTHATCNRINKIISLRKGLTFGDPARYIVKKTNKKLGLLKAQIINPDNPVLSRLTIEQKNEYLDWGYCTTIHAQIGETIESTFGIHDLGHNLFDKSLMYTAVTRAKSFNQIVLLT